MKVVIENRIPYIKGVLEPLFGEVCYLPAEDITPDAVRDADVLLTRTRTHCNAQLLAGSRVRFIGTATIGTDHIDLGYCAAQGITWANAPGCNAPAVAQWVMCSILEWCNHQPAGLTLGVVGVGHVGSIVARWAETLGMTVLRNDPPLQKEMESRGEQHPFVPLHTVQQEADIITFHTPLDDTTRHLCNAQFLQDARRCRLLMNAARGAICDTQALLQWHGDLAIDCWENEPNINLALLEKAVIATPHIAGYSKEGKQRATAMILQALGQWLAAQGVWQNALQTMRLPSAPATIGSAPITIETLTNSYAPQRDTATLKQQLLAATPATRPKIFESLRNNYLLRPEP